MAAVSSTGHLLKRLRVLMQTSNPGPLDAYIVPSVDAHQSEYIAECDMRRQFISKFTGSFGTAIVTKDKAALWTDGRYHLQASKQLDLANWTLMKEGLPETPTRGEWLKDVLRNGSKVGVDPLLVSQDAFKSLSEELIGRNIELVSVEQNLIDQVWEDSSVLIAGIDSARPKRPRNMLKKLDVTLTGKEWTDKVAELRTEMRKKKTSAIILTALDEIAWLLNLRGTDIDFNPVFFAYCIVTLYDLYLFIDEAKLSPDIKLYINAISGINNSSSRDEKNAESIVRILPYDRVCSFIKEELVYLIGIEFVNQSIWVNDRTPKALVAQLDPIRLVSMPSPVEKQKAIKNEVEVENMRNCHIRDGAALCEYLAWLEKTIEANPDGHESLWEIPGADYLEKCRSQQLHFQGLSFPSISSSGPNGAIIHYHPEESSKRPISKKELYLIDSGAQYLDGTTDVTRTVHFGEPTEKERLCFTHVLKGHIQLAMAVFPNLVKGAQLDSFARQSLWSQGLDYLHGTGHGVGMFLNVHEGPTSISPRFKSDDPGLSSGHIMSNEPGYYEDGAFGIRIENLVVAREAETRFNFKDKGFLKFETLTLCPIQLKMIDLKLMTEPEIEWLNEYHAICRQKVGSHLEQLGKLDVKQWLIKETEKVTLPSK